MVREADYFHVLPLSASWSSSQGEMKVKHPVGKQIAVPGIRGRDHRKTQDGVKAD